MAADLRAKEDSDLIVLDCEELDYEGDDKDSTVDVEQEEGEIVDLEDDVHFNNLTCAFFQRGTCALADKCPLLHVTDKGLYKMLDSPPSSLSTFINVVPNASLDISEQQEEDETTLTDWDWALKEAKKRVEEWDNKVNRKCLKTITSDDEQSHLKLKKKTGFNELPSPNVSRDSPHSFTFSGILGQKSPAKENERPRKIRGSSLKGRFPYHRRKKTSKSSISSKSRSDSRSPLRQKSSHLSLSKQHSHRKQLRSSSGSGSSSVSRFKKLRRKIQKKVLSEIPEKKSCRVQNEQNGSSKHVDSIKRARNSSDKQPIISRQSSRSRSPALMCRSREGRLITETKSPSADKKTHPVERKPQNYGKGNDSIKKRAPLLFKNADKQPIVAHRSRSKSPASVHCSRKEKPEVPAKIQSITSERKSRSIEKKSNRNSKNHDLNVKKPTTLFGNFSDQKLKNFCQFSSKSNSPAPMHCSKKLKIQEKTKPATPEIKSHSVKDKHGSNPRDYDSVKKKTVPSFEQHTTDVRNWTPKKTRLPSKNCSDMSISPLTDSSLSDLFDPDKKTDSLDILYWNNATQSRLCRPKKRGKVEVYGPLCPLEIQPTTPKPLQAKASTKQMIETKNFVAQNKTNTSSVSKSERKRNFKALECDLLKFHKRQTKCEASKPVFEQKKTKRLENKSRIEAPRLCVQRKPLTRKESLLQQLEKINEAIEEKRKAYAKSDKYW